MPATEILAPTLEGDLRLITEAAREAGRIAHGFFRRDPQVWFKAGQSPVSEADYAADKFLRETLLAARPDYGWLSEETADTPDRLSMSRCFVVDPVDGTRAFVEGRETWCVSVAVVERGRPLAGVLECPALRETFTATLGGGAFLDGKTISVRALPAKPEVAGAKAFVDALAPPWNAAHRAAHIPSLAYRIALIAKGHLDATLVKPNAHDWDLAAADLILREAGGAVLDATGEAPLYATTASPAHGVLVAGSGALLEAAVSAAKRVVP